MWGEKVLYLSLLLGCVLVLGLAFVQHTLPDGRGVVGPIRFPPCGFRLSTGVPCPTCYLTRSFTLMAHGRVGRAFLLQPFGAVLFLVLLPAVPLLVVALLSRRSFWPHLAALPWRTLVLVLAGLALLSWGYTILRDTQFGSPVP